MSLLRSFPVDDIRARGSIKDRDVERLESGWRQSGEIQIGDVEALLRLNAACSIKDPAWSDLFVEIVTDCVVRHMEPTGYLNLTKMRWLLARIVSGDDVPGRSELELVLNVIDKARWSPASLAAFALNQIRRAVVSGEGPLRGGARLAPGQITAVETDYIRRVLFAYGKGKSLAVTSAEAAALVEICAALAPAAMPAEWTDLYVKAMANAVLSAGGYAAPTREEALRIAADVAVQGRRTGAEIIRDAFAPSPGGRESGNVAAASMAAAWGTYRRLSAEEQALQRLERQRIEIITDETMPPADAAWLRASYDRRPTLNAAEKALIAALVRDCPSIDGQLGALASAHAGAAA